MILGYAGPAAVHPSAAPVSAATGGERPDEEQQRDHQNLRFRRPGGPRRRGLSPRTEEAGSRRLPPLFVVFRERPPCGIT